MASAVDWVTRALLGLAGALALMGTWAALTGRGLAGAGVPYLFAVALLATVARTPLRLTLTPDALVVHTLTRHRRLALTQIRTIEVALLPPGTRIVCTDGAVVRFHPWALATEHLAFQAGRLAPHITVVPPEPEWW